MLDADGCKRALPGNTGLLLTRRGESLRLGTAVVPAVCVLTLPAGDVSIALQAEADAELSELSVTRL
jgi:hypothetical protein